MAERGLLRHTEPPHLTTKRTIDGTRRRVLSLATTYLAPEVGQLGHVGHDLQNAGQNGHCCPTSTPHFSAAPEFSGAANWGSTPENLGENDPEPQSPHWPHSW
jgi:hypothetical protein